MYLCLEDKVKVDMEVKLCKIIEQLKKKLFSEVVCPRVFHIDWGWKGSVWFGSEHKRRTPSSLKEMSHGDYSLSMNLQLTL